MEETNLLFPAYLAFGELFLRAGIYPAPAEKAGLGQRFSIFCISCFSNVGWLCLPPRFQCLNAGLKGRDCLGQCPRTWSDPVE